MTLALVACTGRNTLKPYDYVDPFIGTAAHGHTYPGATVPFGAVQLSPDNYTDDWDACSGYHYDHYSIIGFSHTHLSGTGCADLSDILFHPCCIAAKEIDPDAQKVYEPLPYVHENETACPGYYSVNFPESGLKVELTAGRHTGWHRYTWPEDKPFSLIIDLRHTVAGGEVATRKEIRQAGPDAIEGLRFSNGWTPDEQCWFSARFSREIENVAYSKDNDIAVVTFKAGSEPLVACVGLSYVSCANARENAVSDSEGAMSDFEGRRGAAEKQWREYLDDKIVVEGGTPAQKRTFYTALYHTAIVPNQVSDSNCDFRRNNGEIAAALPGHKIYSTLSLWDIYRSWLPLSSLIYTDVLHDMVFSMLDMYDATGELPIWPLCSGETKCMIGYHSVPFIVEAWFDGIVPELDTEHALEAMVKSSDINEKGSEYYTAMGYIPADKAGESVSCTLEYSYDDWCIARFAESLGKKDIAEKYYGRSKNYANVFDAETKFFRAKDSRGRFVEPFSPFRTGREYTEANAWQYRYFAPQDIKGMSALMGGDEAFCGVIDELFAASSHTEGHVSDMTGFIGQYVHGNEPSHHIAYLYNYIGKPWKTQEMTRRILDEMYTDAPDGIPGNEDCGQMSAWYVLSALGIYEICPGSGEYTFTTPLFDRATVNLPGGRQLVITADNPSVNRYIDEILFNGVKVEGLTIPYSELAKGGQLHFVLRDFV